MLQQIKELNTINKDSGCGNMKEREVNPQTNNIQAGRKEPH